MDLRNFLDTVLPKRGVYYVMRLKPRAGKKAASIHSVVGDIQDVADEVLALDAKYPDNNVYFALATYKEAQFKTQEYKDKDGVAREFKYVVGRTQDNAHSVKCLWIDWDVGKTEPDGTLAKDSYASRGEAVDAMKRYVKETGLPSPIVVNSGYGFHTYWPFDEEVTAQEWENIAGNQRAIMRHMGIKFDPSRDKDCASVLRPPSCFNKKAGKPNVEVKIIKAEVNSLPAAEYKRILTKYVAEHNLTAVHTMSDVPDFIRNASNDLLAGFGTKFPDSYAAIAVNHCNQLKAFSETGGGAEPVWHKVLGLMKHFKDGERYAHEWGSKYAAYTEAETNSYMERWTQGPTLCTTFKDFPNSACGNCARKCTTAVQLGYEETIEQPNPVAAAAAQAERVEELGAPENLEDDGEIVSAEDVNVDDIFWPRHVGYNEATGNIVKRVQDSDGLWGEVPIATPLFFPVEQIRAENGEFSLRIKMLVRGKFQDFLLPTKALMNPRSLVDGLAARRVVVLNDKEARSMLAQQMIHMLNNKDETLTFAQMGWTEDMKGFVLGDRLITPESERKIVLREKFPSELRNAYGSKGNRQDWIDAVNTLYNREHGEPYQFAVCTAFGGILNKLMGFSEWNGIPLAMTSDQSGYGKSTVNIVALSMYMQQTRDTIIGDSTPKAILGMASAYNSVPYLIDEVTRYLKDPADQMDILYALSNGTPRKGMTKGGEVRQNAPSWCGTCIITGNRNIMHQLSENNSINPEAAQMRIFEVDMERYPRIATMDKNHPDYAMYNAEHAELAKRISNESYGHIGVEWIRFAIKNQDRIRKALIKINAKLSKLMVGGDATKERFYYHLIACSYIGGYFAKELGFIQFDMTKVLQWAVKHVAQLRDTSKDNIRTSDDLCAKMLADMTSHIIVTKYFDVVDSRSKHLESHQGMTLRTPIYGRLAVGDEKARPKLFLTLDAVRHWCSENGMQLNALRRAFIKDGIIRMGYAETNRENGSIKVSLTKGVIGIPGARSWCIEIDVDRIMGVVRTTNPADVIRMDKAA